MISARDKECTVQLVASYAKNAPTEELLTLVAETVGMLDTCALLLQAQQANDQTTTLWVKGKCQGHGVNYANFIAEITQVASLFKPLQHSETVYDLFGLEPGASREAIKQRYRQLCRIYHPDTATGKNAQCAEAFIQITQAYHALLSNKDKETTLPQPVAHQHWRRKSAKNISNELKKKNVFWFSVLAISLTLISLIAARAYNSKIMMAGLRNKGSAFVPPAINQLDDEGKSGRSVSPDPIKEETSHSSDMASDAPALAKTVTQETLPLVSTSAKVEVSAPGDGAVSHEGSPPEMTTPPQPQPPVSRETGPLDIKTKEITQLNTTPVPVIEASPLSKKKPPTETQPRIALQQNFNPGLHHDRALKSPSPQDIPKEKPREVTSPQKRFESQPQESVAADKADNLQSSQEVGHTMKEPSIVPKGSSPENQPATGPSLEQQTQKQIDNFLKEYTAAYHQKNLAAFSRFFASGATENGKTLNKVLPDYTKLFATTESLNLNLALLNWQRADQEVVLHGRFNIHLTYLDGKDIQGRGSIDFVLTDGKETLQIQTLKYVFDQ